MISKENKEFLKLILSIVIPVSFQGLIATTLNMADTVMVSSLGESSIAAVGLVNQYMYFFFVTIFGICSGSAIFMSQYYGKRDNKNINIQYAIMMVLVFLIGLVFTICSIIFKNQLLALLSHEQEVRDQAKIYLDIIIWTFVITGLSFGVTTAFRSCGNAKIPVQISVVSFFTNIFFNYVLIFGKLGFPALGVAGAAYGTLIARIIELLVSLFVLSRPFVVFRFDIKYLFELNKEYILRYFKIAAPVIAAETLWSLSQLFFSVIYARNGKQAVAAVQITNTIQNVFFILSNSFCAAASVIIGQLIGSKDYDKTNNYASKFLKLTIFIGLASSAILMLFPNAMLLLYRGLEPGLKDVSKNLLIIRGIFILFRFINAMFVIGIFRGGGDSRIPLLYEIFTIWVLALPASIIATFILNLNIEKVFIIVSLEEVIKMALLIPRYLSGKWLVNVTE